MDRSIPLPFRPERFWKYWHNGGTHFFWRSLILLRSQVLFIQLKANINKKPKYLLLVSVRSRGHCSRLDNIQCGEYYARCDWSLPMIYPGYRHMNDVTETCYPRFVQHGVRFCKCLRDYFGLSK